VLGLGLGLDGDREPEVPSVADAERPGRRTGPVTPGERAPRSWSRTTTRPEGRPRSATSPGGGRRRDRGRADGGTAAFRVREIQHVDKKDFPTNKVYGKTDRPELRLITCGGPIKEGPRSDHIIFFADLVK
jgi:hypothetical protein